MAEPRLPHRGTHPRRFDELGLDRALGDRLLPLLVAAMSFLAALTLAGAIAAAAVAAHWRAGAGRALTVQVPDPAAPAAGAAGSRDSAVLALLRSSPGIATARQLTGAELQALLRPWLGSDAGKLPLRLPAVIAVRLAAGTVPPAGLAARLAAAAPGVLVERHASWAGRIAALARSLQACAAVILLLVTLVAAAVVTVATRAGLAARREAIEIVHCLGATDGHIAGLFARRTRRLAGLGGLAGTLLAVPVLFWLGSLAAPFVGLGGGGAGRGGPVPLALLLALPVLPLGAGLIGHLTARITVRVWLRLLP